MSYTRTRSFIRPFFNYIFSLLFSLHFSSLLDDDDGLFLFQSILELISSFSLSSSFFSFCFTTSFLLSCWSVKSSRLSLLSLSHSLVVYKSETAAVVVGTQCLGGEALFCVTVCRFGFVPGELRPHVFNPPKCWAFTMREKKKDRENETKCEKVK